MSLPTSLRSFESPFNQGSILSPSGIVLVLCQRSLQAVDLPQFLSSATFEFALKYFLDTRKKIHVPF